MSFRKSVDNLLTQNIAHAEIPVWTEYQKETGGQSD